MHHHPTASLSSKLSLILKGIAMGTANKIPGVSGGVVAYVAGFYEEFIYSFSKLNAKSFKLLLNFRFRSFFTYINGPFLALLFLGELLSYFTVSKIFDVIIEFYPVLIWALFFGMILGSIYFIAKYHDNWNNRNILLLLLGTAIGVGTSLLEPAADNDNLFFVFLCGIVSICGMTLPGLSGSFILILLGNYVLLLVDSINVFFDVLVLSVTGNFTWYYDPATTNMLSVFFVFVLGSITGIISLSHLLGWTFKHYKDETNATIIGFITGSLGVVWPWKKEDFAMDASGTIKLDDLNRPIIENYTRYWPDIADSHTYVALFMIILGIFLLYLLDRYDKTTYT